MNTPGNKPPHTEPSDIPGPEELERMLTPAPSGLGDLAKLGLVVGGLYLAASLLSKPSKGKHSFVPGPVDNVVSLGKAILQRRTDLGLTQEQLAERCGVGTRFVSEVENGKATAEIGKVLQLIDTLDLQLAISNRPTS